MIALMIATHTKIRIDNRYNGRWIERVMTLVHRCYLLTKIPQCSLSEIGSIGLDHCSEYIDSSGVVLEIDFMRMEREA